MGDTAPSWTLVPDDEFLELTCSGGCSNGTRAALAPVDLNATLVVQCDGAETLPLEGSAATGFLHRSRLPGL